jgi:hypothetical protein
MIKSESKYFTLITGGSSGIGKALAMECASRGMNLAIVALPGQDLISTCDQITSRYSIEVRHLGLDLTEADGPQKVYEWCLAENIIVNFLINNAGLVGTVSFEESEPEYTDKRIMLNVRSLALITRHFIPMLRTTGGAKILNVGSFSGFFPIPYKSIYSASKAFVLSFTNSLAIELKGSGIRVSVVCPSGVDTNPRNSKILDSYGFWGKLVRLSPENLAVLTLNGVEKGRRVITPLFINRFLLFINQILPERTRNSILEKKFHNEMILQKNL